MAASFTVFAAVASCGDATGPTTFANQDAHVTVFALSGSAQNAPSAIELGNVQFGPVVVGPTFAFHVAFDINASNQVVIYSPRSLANQLTNTARVGFQFTTQTFDQITVAPTKGFVYDTTMIMPPNQTLLLDAGFASCSFSLAGSTIRAKLTVDSVYLTQRKIFVHVFSDPNCGFKDLSTKDPALPKG
jgi:hypothetical protein